MNNWSLTAEQSGAAMFKEKMTWNCPMIKVPKPHIEEAQPIPLVIYEKQTNRS